MVANIQNQDFLRNVFGSVKNLLWVCSFKGSPEDNPSWKGHAYNIEQPILLAKDNNNYFCVSELSLHGKRDNKGFVRLAVLVLDDADISSLCVLPSYIIETSPGKHQVGYILNDTEEARDAKICKNMLSLLSKSGYKIDKSGNNIIRYVRLPVGTNQKRRQSGPFTHRLISWNPERKYNLSDLCSLFKLDLSIHEVIESSRMDVTNYKLDLKRAIDEILTGESFHDNLIRLAGRYVTEGMDRSSISKLLTSLMEMSDAVKSDILRVKSRIEEIPKAVESAFLKFGNEFTNLSKEDLPRPLNLFPEKLKSIPEWNKDDYPEIIARFSEDVSKRTGVDPIIPAWSMIATAAALLPDQYTLQVKQNDHTWKESARLWVALVGEPSTKKTPGMAAVLGALKKMQSSWHEKYLLEKQAWENAVLIARHEKRPEPKQPFPRKVYVNDTTLEALSKNLVNNEGGLLSLNDELSGWFGSMDCYRGKSGGASKDRAAWLTAYNGGPHFVDRVGNGPQYISNFSLSILGGIQPDPMRRFSANLGDHDGLLQRFIVLNVKPSREDCDIAPDFETLKGWEDMCMWLAECEEMTSDFKFDHDAQRLINDARNKIRLLGTNLTFSTPLQSAIQKGEGQLARLALIFHVLENRENDCLVSSGRYPSDLIRSETVIKAINIYMKCIIPNLVYFYHNVIEDSEEAKLTRRVAGFLLANNLQKVSNRDIYRVHRELRDKDSKYLLERIVSHLEMASWLSPIPNKNGKVPTSWYVNPRIYIDFPDELYAEKERRERVKMEIKLEALSRVSLKMS